ncbi:hypothetical protein TWF281_009756 [Arthrobotrys megalospora]
MHVLDLPIEIQTQILGYLPDVLDQVSASSTYPLWQDILQNFRSLRKTRYNFLRSGVGVHNILSPMFGGTLRCRVDAATSAVMAYAYTFPLYFYPGRPPFPLTKSPFLDEPLIWPGSIPDTEYSLSREGVQIGLDQLKSEPHPIDDTDTALDPHQLDTNQNHLDCFLYDLVTINNCTCKPVSIKIELEFLGVEDPLGLIPQGGFTVRQVIDATVRKTLSRGGDKINEEVNNPTFWVFSFSGHHYSTWLTHGRELCDSWVLSGTYIPASLRGGGGLWDGIRSDLADLTGNVNINHG